MLESVEQPGKRFKTQHIYLFRMERGLIVEHWVTRNDIGRARRLGLLPEATAFTVR
jgi:hypothetical protein